MGLATAEFYVTPYRAMKQREAVLAIRGGRRLPTRTSLPLRLGYDLQHMGRVRLSIAGAVGSQPSSDKCRLRKSCSDGGGDIGADLCKELSVQSVREKLCLPQAPQHASTRRASRLIESQNHVDHGLNILVHDSQQTLSKTYRCTLPWDKNAAERDARFKAWCW